MAVIGATLIVRPSEYEIYYQGIDPKTDESHYKSGFNFKRAVRVVWPDERQRAPSILDFLNMTTEQLIKSGAGWGILPNAYLPAGLEFRIIRQHDFMSKDGLYHWFDESPNRPAGWVLNERAAIQYLLSRGTFKMGYVNAEDMQLDGDADKDRLTLSVNANDLFAWACSDSVEIRSEEALQLLVEMVKENPIWGTSKWCCIQENLKPQNPIISDMKKAGVWDDVMEQLRDNPSSNQCLAPGPCELHGKE